MLSSYLPVLLMIVAGIAVAGGMLALKSLLGPRNATPEKQKPFECGRESTGSAHARFSIKFYLVALLFIAFDIEIVFLYPWAVVAKGLGVVGLVQMGVFLGVLVLGFIYVWKKGALEWD
ncbi:MAG: NADH-quinone oxidoreductase subunit A [Deltaproteobacteria bacterium]|nr:NADH-quinone oxidoreductase subunit A [Deltaproteobacteria bacterium]